MKAFYSGLKQAYGPQKKSTAQLLDLDGETIISDKKYILNRFANHYSQLLNIPRDIDHEAVNSIAQRL